jgi:protein N-terminal methyltransferase
VTIIIVSYSPHVSFYPSEMTLGGHDGNGTEFESLDQVWGEGGDEWYNKAHSYWDQQDASINGVLGGFGDLHPTDVAGSDQFLNMVFSQFSVPRDLGADCGAGIGRITQYLLQKHLQKIDIVEPCEKLIERARMEFGNEKYCGNFFNYPLQSWNPRKSTYSLLWHQWVLLYLTDKDCVDYLVRCRESLVQGGVVCVKENVSMKTGQFLVDSDDNSVTRTLDQYKSLFAQAGLRIALQMKQPRWPSHLFPVLMFALVPISS